MCCALRWFSNKYAHRSSITGPLIIPTHVPAPARYRQQCHLLRIPSSKCPCIFLAFSMETTINGSWPHTTKSYIFPSASCFPLSNIGFCLFDNARLCTTLALGVAGMVLLTFRNSGEMAHAVYKDLINPDTHFALGVAHSFLCSLLRFDRAKTP